MCRSKIFFLQSMETINAKLCSTLWHTAILCDILRFYGNQALVYHKFSLQTKELKWMNELATRVTPKVWNVLFRPMKVRQEGWIANVVLCLRWIAKHEFECILATAQSVECSSRNPKFTGFIPVRSEQYSRILLSFVVNEWERKIDAVPKKFFSFSVYGKLEVNRSSQFSW